jgi:xylan 1,4-beta-xylosidase
MANKVIVNPVMDGEAYDRFWNFCVGAGRANEGLRASWLEHLQLVKDNCGFQYCRFHGLFHEDMFIYNEDKDGNVFYNWQYVDDLFDRMLKIGVKPFVELGFCPAPLADGESTVFWWKGRTNPPKDWDKWGELISALVNHLIHRYGSDEVRTWFFEVWNEPNLCAGFFDGTKSQYFEMYRVSVEAIKAIDPQLRVGGPATSNFVPDERFDSEREDTSKHMTFEKDLDELEWKGAWIEDFLAFTTENNLPVDFVSTHPYPTDWALDSSDSSQLKGRVREQLAPYRDCTWLKEVVSKSAYPNAEIHLTEWNSSPSPRDFTHDFVQEAVYVVKTNLQLIGLVDSLSYWTFTDVFEESGAGPEYFHGGFGMINYQTIAKPAFHAYRFLNQLGSTMLYKDDDCAVTKTDDGRIVAVAYNYPAAMNGMTIDCCDGVSREPAYADRAKGEPIAKTFQFDGLAGSRFEVELFDRNNGSAFDAYEALGMPVDMTLAECDLLREKSFATKKTIVTAADGVIELELDPWAMALIRQI